MHSNSNTQNPYVVFLKDIFDLDQQQVDWKVLIAECNKIKKNLIDLDIKLKKNKEIRLDYDRLIPFLNNNNENSKDPDPQFSDFLNEYALELEAYDDLKKKILSHDIMTIDEIRKIETSFVLNPNQKKASFFPQAEQLFKEKCATSTYEEVQQITDKRTKLAKLDQAYKDKSEHATNSVLSLIIHMFDKVVHFISKKKYEFEISRLEHTKDEKIADQKQLTKNAIKSVNSFLVRQSIFKINKAMQLNKMEKIIQKSKKDMTR